MLIHLFVPSEISGSLDAGNRSGLLGCPRTRQQLIDGVIPSQKQFFALGARPVDSPNNDVRNLATALFAHALPNLTAAIRRRRRR